jgi:hypothetical protein
MFVLFNNNEPDEGSQNVIDKTPDGPKYMSIEFARNNTRMNTGHGYVSAPRSDYLENI